MLIRSQNRDYVVPLNSCECVCVSENTNGYTGEKTYLVKACFNDVARVIGEYGTEGRAKEVLHDIILYESIMKAIELKVDVADVELGAFADMMFDCYDMPAE